MLTTEKTANYPTGFFFLILFCVFRPLTFLDIEIKIAGLNVLELFAIMMSYILLICIALNFRKIKFDFVSIVISWFCSYCFISIFWGSDIRTVSQVTLPFVLFFSARIMVNDPKQIKLLMTVLIVTYSIPIVGSFYQIIKGNSIEMVESLTGIARYGGIYQGIKPLSYSMVFFSFFFYMQVNINQVRNRLIKWVLLVLLIISIFCLYKTYARIAYLGLMFFWGICLWGYNKKYFFTVLISSLIIGILYFTNFQEIFFKTQAYDLNTASSGRLFLWKHNINLFLTSSFDRKLLGHGLGVGSYRVTGTHADVWSSHNDYLHLLMELGIIGIVVYLTIILLLLKDVYTSSINKDTKYFYYGVIFSLALMNFFGDVTVYGVGISQQFWMVMGFLYVFRAFGEISSPPGPRNGNGNMAEPAQSRSSEIYDRGFGIYKP